MSSVGAFQGRVSCWESSILYPLTVAASRYPMTCEALSFTEEDHAFTVFEGSLRIAACLPFASAHALPGTEQIWTQEQQTAGI